MGEEEADSSVEIDPQLVGNSFVEQYYEALHQYPEHLHRFYQDSSVLGRPGPDGLVTLVTTMKGINEQILALNYQDYQTEILTVDAQGSYCSGVLVLVTGYLIGKDTVKRKFCQSFFLAPQENGFYVLNDAFRFVEDEISIGMPIPDIVQDHDPPIPYPSLSSSEPNHVPAQSTQNHTTSIPATSSTPPLPTTTTPSSPKVITNNDDGNDSHHDYGITSTETLQQNHAPDHHHPIPNNHKSTTSCSPEVNTNNVKPEIATHDHIQIEADSIPEQKQSYVDADLHPALVLNQNGIQSVLEANNPWAPDAGSRKSFASVVHALKDKSTPFQIRAPPPSFRKSNVTSGSKTADPVKNNDEQAKNKAVIFVANLPMDVTVDQVKQVFSQFGPIKTNGIRIRNNQFKPNCFSFVEFDAISSMQNAVQASPITFGDRKVYIEEKKGGNEIVNVRRNIVAASHNDNLSRRQDSNPQAVTATVTTTTVNAGYIAGESLRPNQNDGGRGRRVSKNKGGKGARQGDVEKK